MKKQVIEAIKKSIEHWVNMSIDPDNKESPFCDDCPLCKLFLSAECQDDDNCEGCPVREKTGYPLCRGTPWEKAESAVTSFRHGMGHEKGPLIEQLRFLHSLLPKKKS